MKKLHAIVFGLSLLAAGSVMADNILVSSSPWGHNHDAINMTNVFGTDFTSYGNYASATADAIFNGSNSFVMLEGGAASDLDLSSYLGANGASILGWVSSGGSLLIQSAGWNTGFTFGPATLTLHGNSCGALTASGSAAFASTAANQCGSGLAHDTISGAGLTAFMTGDGTNSPIVAGLAYGAGYIMYSGLTNSQFHSNGDSLVDNVIAFTASNPGNDVPEPASFALVGLGLAALVARRRKAK